MVSLNKYEGILSKENAMQCFNKLWNKISCIALYHNLIFTMTNIDTGCPQAQRIKESKKFLSKNVQLYCSKARLFLLICNQSKI